KIKDIENNETKIHEYDLANRLVKLNVSDLLKIEYNYDLNSNVNKIETKFKINNTLLKTVQEYVYDKDNKITNIYLNGEKNKGLQYDYDTLARQTKRTIKDNEKRYETKYEYVTDETNPFKTTSMLKDITNKDNKISYTYDANGNIETITKGEEQTQKYYYDELNQLIREDNKELDKTVIYEYDLGGNALNKIEYEYTETEEIESLPTKELQYTYDETWKDQLIEYAGEEIEYDEIGNPIKVGESKQLKWVNGRQLATYKDTLKELEISYKYNENGIRTEKTVDGITTKYYLEGDRVVYEVTGSNVLNYQYDEQSNLIGFKYNDNQYYYIRNGQNDIIGLLDKDMNQVVTYVYDSWGNIISILDENNQDVSNNQSNIGNINPYTYRGYRYDKETNLYYLQSRYYNPEWGRFINADGLVQTGQGLLDKNMFAYCGNNPINNYDPSGYYFYGISTGTVKFTTPPPATTPKPAPAKTTPKKNIIANTGGSISTALDIGSSVASSYTKTVPGLSLVTASATGASKYATVSFTVKENLKIAPYAKAGKTLGTIGTIASVGLIAWDIGDTWTAQNSNTTQERWIKTGVQVEGFLASVITGAIGGVIIGVGVATGPIGMAVGIPAGIGFIYGSNVGITATQDWFYKKYGIE
ncbi:MAG: RHS repeat-associated core domain-containing protein, partial [Clostridia bacterium]|nr:RHS repeat-associated core domain-containing protein [Clostridia bacterium]